MALLDKVMGDLHSMQRSYERIEPSHSLDQKYKQGYLEALEECMGMLKKTLEHERWVMNSNITDLNYTLEPEKYTVNGKLRKEG